MRLLQINSHLGPEDICPAYRGHHLARQWQALGHEVAIVCASWSHLFRTAAGARLKAGWQEHGGLCYLVLPVPRYQGSGVGRVASMLAFSARLGVIAARVARSWRPDVVICGSVGGLDSLGGFRLARRASALAVREVRDLWPLTLVEMAGLSRYHPLVVALQAAEEYSYRRADLVFTTLAGSLDHMTQRGLAEEKWRYQPQGVTMRVGSGSVPPVPSPYSRALKRMSAEGLMVVGYAGSIGPANALEFLLGAMEILRQDSVACAILGRGPCRADLERAARDAGLRRVLFFDAVSQEQVPSFLDHVDVAYHGCRPLALYQHGISPNKLMDYMLAARPVLNAVPDVQNDVVAAARCGRVVAAGDVQAIAAAIREFASMTRDQRETLGANGRRHVLAHHNYRRIAGTMAREFEQQLGLRDLPGPSGNPHW